MEDEWNCLFPKKTIDEDDVYRMNEIEPANYRNDLENYFSTFTLPLNEEGNSIHADPFYLHNSEINDIKNKKESHYETDTMNIMSFFNETTDEPKNESSKSCIPMFIKKGVDVLIDKKEDDLKINNFENINLSTSKKVEKSVDYPKENNFISIPPIIDPEEFDQPNNSPKLIIEPTSIEEESIPNICTFEENEKGQEDCELTNQFINTVETMNNKISEKKEYLKESMVKLIEEVQNSKFEKQIEDVLEISKMNYESIQEFKEKSSSCIQKCRTFEITSEQLFAECIQTLGYATLCYSEWVCLHSVDFNQINDDISDIKNFMETFE